MKLQSSIVRGASRNRADAVTTIPLLPLKGSFFAPNSNLERAPKFLLTQSLNKRQKIRTMVQELSMVQVAYVGPYQAQLTHIP